MSLYLWSYCVCVCVARYEVQVSNVQKTISHAPNSVRKCDQWRRHKRCRFTYIYTKEQVHGLNCAYLLVEGAQVSVLPHTAQDLRGCLYHLSWVSGERQRTAESHFSWTPFIWIMFLCYSVLSRPAIRDVCGPLWMALRVRRPLLFSAENDFFFRVWKKGEFSDEFKTTHSATLMVPSLLLSWKMTLAGVSSQALPF